MENADRPFWDTYWTGQPATLTARTMSQIMDRAKVQYLRDILPPRGSTLEVGAGSGRLSCILATMGYRTFCLDFSHIALGVARANYAQAQVPGAFVVGEGTELPLRSDSMDVVLSTGLLEHFPDPAPIVREMVRVLKPGGLFYSDIVPKKFSLFRSLDWVGRLKRSVIGQPADEEGFYERAFTNAEIADLLGACGLRDIRVFPAGVVPPYLPIVSRSTRLREGQVRLVELTERLWKRLDGTRLAEWLGFYYFAWGMKPSTGMPA